MKRQLLAGAATLALVTGAWGSAWAQTVDDTNNSNDNTDSSIAQDDSIAVAIDDIAAQIALQAAVFAGANGAENGAIVDNNGNAIGAFSSGNDVAADNSRQSNTDAFFNEAIARNGSTAVENGAAVIGDGAGYGRDANDNATALDGGIAITTGGGGEEFFLSEEESEEASLQTIDGGFPGGDVADDGSVVQLGSGNDAVAADDSSAAVGTGVAISTASDFEFGGPAVDDGSSLVVGDDNSTASADTYSASVGDDGTAIAVDFATEEFFNGDDAVGAQADDGDDGPATDGAGNTLEDDAVAVFGKDNVVAPADIFQVTADLALGNNPFNSAATDDSVSLTTGNIDANTIGSMTGANMVATNSGLVNQGGSVAVTAISSF